MYVDGEIEEEGSDPVTKRSIPTGGEFVLGQTSRHSLDFDTTYAFVGDLAHLNIWDTEMTRENIIHMKNSCNFMYCGTAVEWAEFRSGTRGAMSMRWPSGILSK